MWTAHITEEEEMSGTRWAARIGAIFYILWGVFHLMAAKAVFGLADLANGMTRARLPQDAFYLLAFAVQIGSASCRERVCQYVYVSVVAVSLKKKKQLNKEH